MKKVLSLALALLLMIGALSVSSFASGTPDASQDHDITINVGNGANHVYSADITFVTGSFVFQTESKWDSTIHNYIPGETGNWNNAMGSVTVTNHSDLPVDYTVTIKDIVDTYGETLDIVFDGQDASVKTLNGTIDAVAIGAGVGVSKLLAKWDVTGQPTLSEVDAKKLGTITVTLTMQNP